MEARYPRRKARSYCGRCTWLDPALALEVVSGTGLGHIKSEGAHQHVPIGLDQRRVAQVHEHEHLIAFGIHCVNEICQEPAGAVHDPGAAAPQRGGGRLCQGHVAVFHVCGLSLK